MAEYIEREALMEGLVYNNPVYIAAKCAPAADVAPVVHGRWIMDGKDHCHCSACEDGRNIKTQIGWKFCSNCGAKMGLEV